MAHVIPVSAPEKIAIACYPNGDCVAAEAKELGGRVIFVFSSDELANDFAKAWRPQDGGAKVEHIADIKDFLASFRENPVDAIAADAQLNDDGTWRMVLWTLAEFEAWLKPEGLPLARRAPYN